MKKNIFKTIVFFIVLSICCSATYAFDEFGTGDALRYTNDFPLNTFSSSTFSYGDPTPAEQAHLEAINRARMDPYGEAQRLGIDLFEGVQQGAISGDPVQPLASNAQILQAARLHSEDMIKNQYFDHYSQDGTDPSTRMQNQGYQFRTAGENIAYTASSGSLEEVASSLYLHDILFIDENYPNRGHRVNILGADFKEIGVGLAFGSYQGYNSAYMVTCDFGAALQETNSFVLGVVYDDKNADGIYTAGEGISDVQIDIVESAAMQTKTASAGGYALRIAVGNYTLKATLSDGRSKEKQISISNQNIKQDFLLSEFGQTNPDPNPDPDPNNNGAELPESITLKNPVTDEELNQVKNSRIDFKRDNFTLKVSFNFPKFSQPVDIYVAIQEPEGDLIENLPFYVDGKFLAAAVGISEEYIEDTVWSTFVEKGTWVIYWVIAPSNGGDFIALDWVNGKLELGWYTVSIQ